MQIQISRDRSLEPVRPALLVRAPIDQERGTDLRPVAIAIVVFMTVAGFLYGFFTVV